ncbi:MAG: hypothetical protein JNL10_02480 [Verrucomicrobiales bacterium]|nr:hypothetical protein [Verrucomicrobiales bacterium]
MESTENTLHGQEAPIASGVISNPDFSGKPQPISSMTGRADWPRCALGVHVDIHGFEGVVIQINNQSIRVRSSDRITQQFNAHRLKALFAPPDRSTPVRSIQVPGPDVPAAEPAPQSEPAEPVRQFIENPDFTTPVRAIRTYATRADFPQCAYGQHVEIPGYAGVVVEIVKGSLKVRSQEGRTRSFSAVALRKLYGKP